MKTLITITFLFLTINLAAQETVVDTSAHITSNYIINRPIYFSDIERWIEHCYNDSTEVDYVYNQNNYTLPSSVICYDTLTNKWIVKDIPLFKHKD